MSQPKGGGRKRCDGNKERFQSGGKSPRFPQFVGNLPDCRGGEPKGPLQSGNHDQHKEKRPDSGPQCLCRCQLRTSLLVQWRRVVNHSYGDVESVDRVAIGDDLESQH